MSWGTEGGPVKGNRAPCIYRSWCSWCKGFLIPQYGWCWEDLIHFIAPGWINVHCHQSQVWAVLTTCGPSSMTQNLARRHVSMRRPNTSVTHLDSRVMSITKEIQRKTEDIVSLGLACHGVMQHWGSINPLQIHISLLVYFMLSTQESATALLPGKMLVDVFLVWQTIHLLDHTMRQLTLSKYWRQWGIWQWK